MSTLVPRELMSALHCLSSVTISALHWALSAAAFASAARRSDDVTVSPVAVWKLKVLSMATMASALFDGARVCQQPGSADREVQMSVGAGGRGMNADGWAAKLTL